MSENKQDYKNNFIVDCTMTPREYYDFRLQALNNKVHFIVEWKKDCCIVTTEAPFLVRCGYVSGIDF
jgi:hypothetical protein